MITRLAITAAVLYGALNALAQSPSDVDKHFMQEAIEGGNAEVRLGQLAEQKSKSEDVKQFGQKMIDDHTKLGDQMRSVAEKIGVAPPSGTPVGDKARSAELTMLSGDSFDKAYIKAMVEDHREDLKSFQREEMIGTAPEVKEAAKDGEKVIQRHLQLAEQIAKNHNVEVNK